MMGEWLLLFLLLGVGKLLGVELDDAGVLIAQLGLHVLVDLGQQLARQFAQGLSGVLLHVLAEAVRVGGFALGGAPFAGNLGQVRLAGLITLLLGVGQLLGGLVQGVRGVLHRRLGALGFALAQLVLG